MVDLWTSQVTKATFIDCSMQYWVQDSLKTVSIGTVGFQAAHTGVEISKKVDEVLESWEIRGSQMRDLLSSVTDSGSNVISAMTKSTGLHSLCYCTSSQYLPQNFLGANDFEY